MTGTSEGDVGGAGDFCRIAAEIDPVIAGAGDKTSAVSIEYGEIPVIQCQPDALLFAGVKMKFVEPFQLFYRVFRAGDGFSRVELRDRCGAAASGIFSRYHHFDQAAGTELFDLNFAQFKFYRRITEPESEGESRFDTVFLKVTVADENAFLVDGVWIVIAPHAGISAVAVTGVIIQIFCPGTAEA